MYETTSANEKGVSIPPPRLHWGWVLALSLCTAFLFYGAWLIVQSNWSRRARGKSVAFPMSIILCAAQLGSIFALPGYYHHTLLVFGFVIADTSSSLLAGCWVIAILLRIANLFILRAELMNEPISMLLSGPMTFFFGPIYFQYHLRDYQGRPVKRVQGLGIS